MDDEIVAKFHSNYVVDPETTCYNWTGWIGSKGYAQFSHKKRFYTASRFAYQLYYGVKPGRKLVCHKCDNPKCVNPMHLFLGTQKDNMRDMLHKNRGVKSRPDYERKLNETKVRKINKYLAFGMTQIMVAEQFGIHRTTVSKIKNGHSWSHVDGFDISEKRVDIN